MACRRFLKLKVWLSHRTAGAPEGLSVEASDAAATSRRLSRTSRHIALLFLPDCEGFGEGAVPRQTLFYGQDGSAAIAVGDWDVEPGAFLEHLNIALPVSTGSRKLDHKNTIRR